MKGSDHAFSLEPEGMRKMVRDLKRTVLALGDSVKKIYEEEKGALEKMGKSIVAAKALSAGHIVRKSDLAFKSPFESLHPYETEKIIGKKLKVKLRKDQPLLLEYV